MNVKMYNLFIFYTLLSALISSDIYNLFVNFYSTSLIYITITLTNRYINMREIFVILLLSANFEKNIEIASNSLPLSIIFQLIKNIGNAYIIIVWLGLSIAFSVIFLSYVYHLVRVENYETGIEPLIVFVDYIDKAKDAYIRLTERFLTIDRNLNILKNSINT